MILFDDGQHNDNEAGDNVWGNSITLNNRKYPYKGDLIVQTSTEQKTCSNAYSHLGLRPSPELINCRVVWENGKQDSKINNGEKVYLAFDIYNPDNINSIEDLEIDDINIDESIPPGGIIEDDKLFLIRTVPSEGDSASFFSSLNFDGLTEVSKIVMPMEYWHPDPIWGETLEVISVAGISDYIHPIIADRSLLTGHEYMISFTRDDSLMWRLTDQITGDIKIDKVPYTTHLDFPFPVVDGIQWKVMASPAEIKDWDYNAGVNSPLYPGYSDGRWFSGNGAGSAIYGGLYIASNFWPPGGTDLTNLVPVKVHFTPMTAFTDTSGDGEFTPGEPYEFNTAQGQGAFMYSDLNVGNFMQYTVVPFQVFDISDPDNPRQLNVMIYDSNQNGYWELETSSTPAHYLFILSTDYDPAGTVYDPNQGGLDLMGIKDGFPGYYVYKGISRGLRPFLAEGGILSIIPYEYNDAGDTFLVKTPTSNTTDLNIPETYELHQNFPNPFNPETRIDVSLKKESIIDIEIYNILGQKVKTLVRNEQLLARRYEYFWKGLNDNGQQVSSGIYFYRLNVNSGEFVSVKKMLLVK